jgi:uncharacterized protein with HEPN domain
MKPSRAVDYLDHMIGAIDRIVAYIDGLDRAGFDASTQVQDAVIRNVEIIGEAARNILLRDPNMAATHPEIPWRTITGMRNHLAHGYFEVDLDSVWATVADDLPTLREQAVRVRDDV